jgi:Flp pilus assembly protein TadB
MGNVGGVWLAPALLGVALIVFGVLIFVVPKLLQLIVAAVFIFAGCALLGLAWHMRGRITYRRLDEQEPRDL